MKLQEQKLITKQISRRLEEISAFKVSSLGIKSWSEYIRQGLGMTVSQLAKRLNCAQSTTSQAEKLEKEGRITINKLREMADALNCDLVYAFVPRKKLEDIIEDQATKKVLETMELAETHMSLEDQKVTIEKEERLAELKEEKKYSKHLWD